MCDFVCTHFFVFRRKSMRKTTAKVLAMVLTVVMLVGIAPTAAFAENVIIEQMKDLGSGDDGWYNFDESGKCGDNVYWSFNNTTGALIIYGSGDMYDYSFIDDPFTDVYSSPFQYESAIKSIVIEDGVTSIGRLAFNSCYCLTSVTIGNDVTSIGYEAFEGCTGLTSVTIGNSVMSIGNSAFSLCYNLSNVTLGNNLLNIGDNAFAYCSSLTSIEIPNSVTRIGKYAFVCTSLTSVEIPDSVTSIGVEAFWGCTRLTSITVDENNKNYYSDEFGILYNKDKTELIQYPIGNTRTSFSIPDSVTSVGGGAFGYYEGLNLTIVEIPDSVTSIGEYAFYGVRIVFYNGEATGSPWGAAVIISSGYMDGYLIYESEEKNTLQACYTDAKGKIVIPDSVKNIGDGAFYNCTSLTSIEIPDSVTTIGSSAFYGCSSLTSIIIPESVTSIDNNTFAGCTSLTSFIIRDSVTSIDEGAFKDCSNLTSIEISESVTSIGYDAFWGCEKLTIHCYEGSYAHQYAIDNEIPFELIEVDDTTGIKIGIAPGIYDGDVTLHVAEVQSGTSFELVGQVENAVASKVFSIKTLVDGQETQPNGNVTVKIPIPEGFDASKCKLYYLDTANNQAVEVDFTVEGNYIVFTTDHFSDWAVVEISGHDHIPGQAVKENEVAPTCTEQGSYDEVVYCTFCGEEISREKKNVNALGHDYDAVVTNPTCTEAGYTTHTCSRCKDSYTDSTVNALGHDYDAVVTNPTCTEAGYTTHTCSRCKDSYTDSTVNALGHDYDAVVKNPTCTEAGYTTHTCSRCKDSYTDSTVNATGHTEGEWQVTVPATLTSEGTKELYCAVCGATMRTESIPKLTQQDLKVKSVSISDMTLGYRSSAVITPIIDAVDSAKYNVTYKSNSSAVSVDQNGRVTSNKTFGFTPGSAVITCKVTDSNGNTVTDTCTVTVNFTAIQWIIKIVLFGWIWY